MFGRIWKWIIDVFGPKKRVRAKPVAFHKHEGLKTHRWVLVLPGVDAYLLKSVKLPTIKPGARKGLNPVLSMMTLELMLTVAVPTSADVLDWFNKGDRRRIELRYLTSHGRVAEQWSMVVAPVELKTTDLDYAKSDQVLLTVKVQPFSIDIRGFNVTD